MSIVATTKRTVLILVIALLYGCSSGGSSGDSASQNNIVNTSEVETGTSALIISQPALSWSRCEVWRLLECATLLVPMDYANPGAETIALGLARFGADQTMPKQRNLLLNPGGPGGSGIDYLAAFRRSAVLSRDLRDTFNFISFDPRGIGASTAVNCDTSSLYSQDPYAVNRAEVAFNISKSIEFAQGCVANSGRYLQFLGSLNVVRDMNEIRKALGLTQIDFLGYSYGTRLGALYLQSYPESAGQFVLDGSMTPDPAILPLARGSLLPGQANIDALARACIGITIACNPQKFASDLQRRVDQFGVEPSSPESSLLFLILQLASTQPGFEQLLIGRLATYLETDDIAELEYLDSVLGLSEAAEAGGGINRTAFLGVMCADDSTRPTLDSIEAQRASFNTESDLLGEPTLSVVGMCAGWPESLDPIPPIATNQAPASLVIGGPTDAQTPLLFAEQMATALGGQFLRSEHSGHTTVFTGKNQCTNQVVETFLLTGNLPSVSVCRPGSIAVANDWHDELIRLQN